MNNDLVSIVILNYNGLEYLKRIIPPLLSMDYPCYEIIVVDNCSNDDSINYLKKFNKVFVIKNKKNLGYSQGKNIGVERAGGRYILLLDNDVLVKNKNIINILIDNYLGNIAFLQLPLVDEGMDKTQYYGIYFPIHGVTFFNKFVNIKKILNYFDKLVDVPAVTGGCIFFKKTTWNKIGGFDESQMFNIDDIDIGPRAYLLGYRNVLFTKEYCIHLKQKKKIDKENFLFRFKYLFSGHARSFIKNFKLINIILRLPLLFLFILVKSIRDVYKRKTFKVFYVLLYSMVLFFSNLPDTLRQRKIIQSKRVIKNDMYLKLRCPY